MVTDETMRGIVYSASHPKRHYRQRREKERVMG